MQNIIIPFKVPSLNSLYRMSKFNKIYMTPVGKKYKNDVAEYIKNYYPYLIKYNGAVKLSIKFYLKGNLLQDLDNLLKVLLDSLNDILYVDDKQVFEITCSKHINQTMNETHIEAEEILPQGVSLF